MSTCRCRTQARARSEYSRRPAPSTAWRCSSSDPGSDALLFGAGPTGLMLAQLLAANGAARVTVAAPTEFKLELARELGADETVPIPRDDSAEVVRRLRAVAADGFDVVVVRDRRRGRVRARSLAGEGRGTVLWYGVTRPDDRVAVSPYDVYRRELTIKGSFAEVSSFPAGDRRRSGRGVLRTDGAHDPPLRAGDSTAAPTRLEATVRQGDESLRLKAAADAGSRRGSAVTRPRFGFSVTPGPPDGVAAEAAEAEALGFDRIGVWDSPALFREPWVTLGAMARTTRAGPARHVGHEPAQPPSAW